MSDENKFFRWVWRFNALVLALLCLAGLASLTYNLLSGYFFASPADKPQGHFAPVSSAAEAANTYRLKSSGTVAFLKPDGGQDLELVFSLGNWEGAPNKYGLAHINSSSGYREPYNGNVLLVNSETGASHWLFSGFARNITGWDVVIDPTVKEPPVDVATSGPTVIEAGRIYGDYRAAKALVLKVIEKDSNKDGNLTEGDGLALYIWRPGDAAPAKFLDADLILSQSQIGKDRYTVSYESGGAAWIAIYSVPDFRLLIKKPLPKLPG